MSPDRSGVARRLAIAVVKTFASLIAVEGLLLAAMIIYVRTEVASDAIPGSVRFLPYTVLAAGLLLSWRFRRSRLLFGLIILGLADRALRHVGGGAPGPSGAVFDAVGFLLPLNLAGLSLMIERGTLTPAGLRRFGMITLQVPLVWMLCCPRPSPVLALARLSILPSTWFDWTPVAQPALVLFAAASIPLAIRLVLHPNATGRGFLWALIASFLALHAGGAGPVSTVYFSTAGLLLVVSVIEASYFMSYRDGLTGLPARRALNEALLRLNGTYTVAMIDIDHFKSVNDRYGHDVGDQVLRMVASRLGSVGGGGGLYRYGGEEFVVLFPDCTAEEARLHLERLRSGIEAGRFTVRGPDRPEAKPDTPSPARSPGEQITVTVSIGAAERRDRRSAPSEVISHADKTLYRAKQAGRNRVMVWNA